MNTAELLEEQLTHSVIGAFFDVYNTLGFGFMEHIYELALERELRARGHQVRRQASVRIYYKGEFLAEQRIDLIVDDKLVVETKSAPELHKTAPRQLYNYLRATTLEVGLLLHFGPEPQFFRLVASNKRPPAGKANQGDAEPGKIRRVRRRSLDG